MTHFNTPLGEQFFQNELALEVWNDNYRNRMEMVEGYTHRQSSTIFQNESVELQAELDVALLCKRICFGGRVGANIGTGIKRVHAFNCYAAQRSSKPYDSIHNIYQDLENAAEILKTEGGVGYNFNHLRPKGTLIKGIGSTSPGVVEFMRLYDVSADIITKGNSGEKYQITADTNVKNKTRKGAQMSMLSIRHPDVLDYIEAKKVPNFLTKFNMSVAVTDEFMKAVENDAIWELRFPDIHFALYDEEWAGDFEAWEEKGYPTVVYKSLPAREIWELLLRNTYNRNEPGIYFIDNANRYNNLLYYQKITGTNPCGEISMLADAGVVEIDGVLYEHLGDICNLGTINLVSYWDGKKFDFVQFKSDVHLLIRALDAIIDMSAYPLEGLRVAAMLRRKIGAGLMGYGSLLFMMQMRYGSLEANMFTTVLMDIYANTAYQASALLAKEKGPFMLYDETKYFDGGFVKNSGVLSEETLALLHLHGCRNSQILTAAPNGNTGVLMGIVSGGVEPVYMKEFVRWVTISHKAYEVLGDKPFPDFTKQEWFETEYFKFGMKGDEEVLISVDGDYMIDKSRGLTKRVECEDFGWTWVKANLNEQQIAISEAAGVFACSMELSLDEHLDPFIIFSKRIDNSISKTINLPNDAPFEGFSEMYMRLWKEGVRGCTTYRDGTMTAVLESASSTVQKAQSDFYAAWEGHDSKKVFEDVALPAEYPLMGHIIKSEGKKFYVNVAFKDVAQTRPFAIFVNTNNKETDILTYTVLDVLESLAKEVGVPDEYINRNKAKYSGQTNITKLARTISLLLRHNVPIDTIVVVLDSITEIPISSFIFRIKKFLTKFIDNVKLTEVCPECGAPLMYNEGCKRCSECSFTFCG